MNRWLTEGVLRAAALSGLGMSVLLGAEYSVPAGALCAPGGGCAVVRQSAYAAVLGVPLPFLGVLFFCTVLGVALVPQLRRWLPALGAAGIAAGLAFIFLQAVVIKAFCRMCLIVDVSALIIGLTAITGRRFSAPRLTIPAAAAHLVVMVAIIGGTLRWHASLGAPPPVTAQQPGRVTVVEFVDFECPACREQYGQFSGVLASYADRVNLVLKHMPLPQHQHAMDAARAYCCADVRDKAAEMADRLFKAQQLGREDCEEIAVSLGLDRDEFRRCVESESVAQRLREDNQAAAAAGIRGLPTLWIGQERFEGVHDRAVLEASIQRALQHPSSS